MLDVVLRSILPQANSVSGEVLWRQLPKFRSSSYTASAMRMINCACKRRLDCGGRLSGWLASICSDYEYYESYVRNLSSGGEATHGS